MDSDGNIYCLNYEYDENYEVSNVTMKIINNEIELDNKKIIDVSLITFLDEDGKVYHYEESTGKVSCLTEDPDCIIYNKKISQISSCSTSDRGITRDAPLGASEIICCIDVDGEKYDIAF